MRALGLILAGGKDEKLKELTQNRALAAMPIAGSYRSVDFAISNMANSGVNKVAVVAQYNSRPLIEHLSSSKWWDFGRKHGGLLVLTPYLSSESNMWYRGTADAIYQNIDYLKNSHEPYAIIAPGDGICKIDFNEVLSYHVDKRSDITIVCKEVMGENLKRFGMIQMDEDNRIIDIEEKPISPQGNLVSTGIYIIRRRLLIELIEEITKEGRYDFVNDILIRYRKQKKIFAFIHEGYWKSIASLESYYQANIDFLNKEIRDGFFAKEPIILTKVEDEPPAKFNIGARVTNSLSSSGCIINGEVDHSILFRKVFIGENTVIKNSIILEDCHIGDNCVIENCIVDSKSTIRNDSIYQGGKDDIRIVVNKESIYS